MERSPLTERELQTKLLAKIKENPDVISALIVSNILNRKNTTSVSLFIFFYYNLFCQFIKNIPDELKRSTYDVDVLIAAGYANMNKHSGKFCDSFFIISRVHLYINVHVHLFVYIFLQLLMILLHQIIHSQA